MHLDNGLAAPCMGGGAWAVHGAGWVRGGVVLLPNYAFNVFFFFFFFVTLFIDVINTGNLKFILKIIFR